MFAEPRIESVYGETKSASRTKSCPVGRTKSARCADEIRSCGADGGVSSVASGSTNYEVKEIRAQRSCAGFVNLAVRRNSLCEAEILSTIGGNSLAI